MGPRLAPVEDILERQKGGNRRGKPFSATPVPDANDVRPSQIIGEASHPRIEAIGIDHEIDDHRERVDAVLYELRRTCDYGQALRAELQGVREYLSTRVPGDPNDLDAWRTWRIVYASVVSSLAGAKGDSGFGVEEASLIAERHGVYLDRT